MIPTRMHGVLDYGMAAVLIVAPWLFGFADNGAAMAIPIVVGLTVVAYSLFTNYELGLVRRLSMPTHLVLDGIGGLLLLVSPWLFAFADTVWVPHVIFGLLEIGAAALTQRTPSPQQQPARG